MKKILITILFQLFLVFCFGQNPKTDLSAVSFSDSSDAVLPVLIELAVKNAPQVAGFNATRQDAEDNLALARKEFLKSISLRTAYSYGSINTIFPGADGQITPIYYTGNRDQFSYTVGPSLGFNLEQLFGGKRLRVDKQKVAIQFVESQIEVSKREIRRQVITAYQNLKLSRAILARNQDALQTAYVNKTLAEKQFKEGNLQITEQMTVDQLYTNALLAIETSKNTYQTNLLLLEELVGVPITPLLNKYSDR